MDYIERRYIDGRVEKIKMSANHRQVGGSHYANEKVQHWDFIEDNGIGYLEGYATKYLSRWRNKNGVQDLEKSFHCVEKLRELAEQGRRGPRGAAPTAAIVAFCEAYELGPLEAIATMRLCRQWTVEDLEIASNSLRLLISQEKAQ